MVEHPALNALNARLRDDFVDDCNLGVTRWNKVIEDAGIDFRLALPHVAFYRHIGLYADQHVSPAGEILSEEEWDRKRDEWLPGNAERTTSSRSWCHSGSAISTLAGSPRPEQKSTAGLAISSGSSWRNRKVPRSTLIMKVGARIISISINCTR